ncbi:MAG: 4Fe-4S binding protein [Acidaminococcales bacterium]|nr:4Fe-4S binding protein [Acidaminococcales bacterium]
MKRKIIEIDIGKCNGCGLCAEACHEGAIGMVGGKAKLLRDDCCDGLGNCLPACPTGAVAFVEREAAAYDEEQVKKHIKNMQHRRADGCPGLNARALPRTPKAAGPASPGESELCQWPVKIRLAPAGASYFNGANLLIAADCAAYARANFHAGYMRGKITLIGCPKLDGGDCGEKLAEIIAENDIESVTVVRMEVPCCGGIERAAAAALKKSGKLLPWQVVTLTTDGKVKES